MKHFNWDCECKDCMIMKAGDDLYEALKLIFEAQEIEGDKVVTRTVPSSADVLRMRQALAKVEGNEESCREHWLNTILGEEI